MRYIVPLSFLTLLFFVRLSLKFLLHKLSFEGDYVSKATRGCLIKKFPSVLPIYAKMINFRVKFQAKCPIHFSRALKWSILHLCTLSTSRDTTKFRKLLVSNFCIFVKILLNHYAKSKKMRKIEKLILSVFNHISNTEIWLKIESLNFLNFRIFFFDFA